MLSVIVITKNEEKRIRICLESVKWADEILVLDNGSEDKTLQIVKEYTDKILKFQNEDFASLRNKGMEQAKGEWVLYVDADERVLDALKKEIESLISFSDFGAFAIARRNIIFGREVSFGPYKKDWVIRLLRKKDFETWVGKIHEYPRFKGELGYTKNFLLHLTHRDIDQIVLKSLEWSKIYAKLRFNSNHPKMSGWRFLRILLSETFYQGVVRKGFFNGTLGVMDSVLQSFSLFITYVRLWQMQQSKPLPEIYDDIDEQLIKQEFHYPSQK